MFKRIKELLTIEKRNNLLTELVKEQKKIITKLQGEVGDPKKVVESIFKRGIDWYDYEELKEESRKNYVLEAQSILNSKAFNNEFSFLVSKKLEDLVLEAKDFKDVRDFQMIICGMELFRERLSDIFIPDKKNKK